jgi:hypothetical protein
MSKADYDTFVATGKVPATSETFISPTKAFSEGYVRNNLRPYKEMTKRLDCNFTKSQGNTSFPRKRESREHTRHRYALTGFPLSRE